MPGIAMPVPSILTGPTPTSRAQGEVGLREVPGRQEAPCRGRYPHRENRKATRSAKRPVARFPNGLICKWLEARLVKVSLTKSSKLGIRACGGAFAAPARPARRARTCVLARIGELPEARRTWMGPPSVAFGYLFPRGPARSHPKPPETSEASAGTGPADLDARSCSGGSACETGTIYRDGVAHEAPLSTRVPTLAGPGNRSHASIGARSQMGAPVARPTMASSSK
jgi:hypothetical protein